MKSKLSSKRNLIILLFPVGMLMFYIAPYFPNFIEKVYSNGFYKFLSQFLSLITGIIPISVAELGLILIVILLPTYIIYKLVLIGRLKYGKKQALLRFFSTLLIGASIVYFALITMWSLNYSRLPFSQIAGLNIQNASIDDLASTCENLIIKANKYRESVAENSEGIMILEDGYFNAFYRAHKGYNILTKDYPELGGKYGKPKAVLLSKFMSYTGISGIFCPFTGEANVDVDMPHFVIPSTACHEMAHQRGFAREDEANYIAYLSCKNHPDADFKYSGYMLAVIHSMNALIGSDKEKYSQLRKLYSEGVVRDLRNNNEYWKSFEGPVEKNANSLNNAYLKANMQKDGVKSYGRMVDLLIAEYKAGKA